MKETKPRLTLLESEFLILRTNPLIFEKKIKNKNSQKADE